MWGSEELLPGYENTPRWLLHWPSLCVVTLSNSLCTKKMYFNYIQRDLSALSRGCEIIFKTSQSLLLSVLKNKVWMFYFCVILQINLTKLNKVDCLKSLITERNLMVRGNDRKVFLSHSFLPKAFFLRVCSTYGVKLVQKLHEVLLKLKDDLLTLKETKKKKKKKKKNIWIHTFT